MSDVVENLSAGLVVSGLSVVMPRPKPGRTVLHIDSLDLPSHGMVALIGPNGAGKSTFLRALSGEVAHNARLTIDGLPWAKVRRSYLPQDFSVQSGLSVSECVLLGLHEGLGWKVSAEDRARVAEALAGLGLTHLAGRRMDSLSGGQQQLVLLAQRLISKPRVLLLDEPTSALDLHHQIEAFERIGDYMEKHRTLVIVAMHDLGLAGRFAERLLLIAGGRLLAAGRPAEVLTKPLIDEVYSIDCEVLVARDGSPVVVAHPRSRASADTRTERRGEKC